MNNRFAWLEAPFIMAIGLIACAFLPFWAIWWCLTGWKRGK